VLSGEAPEWEYSLQVRRHARLPMVWQATIAR
jgi:hypothetical protein